jgi:chitodextrinase
MGLYIGVSEAFNTTRNLVINNVILGNGHDIPDGAGIRFWGEGTTSNIVERNDINNNQIGILFDSDYSGSHGMTIRLNTIHNSTIAGVSTNGSGPNTFYLNEFLNNTVHVRDPHPSDTFDNGSMGNFWDDYVERYPSARANGGIWDTPYQVVPGTNVFDRYPLAYVNDTRPPIADAGLDQTVPIGSRVLLDGSLSTADSPIMAFIWNVTRPDGTQYTVERTGPIASIWVHLLGEYTIVLTVNDVWEDSASDTVMVYSIDVNPPVADPGGNYTVNMGEGFTLDASASTDDVGIVVYEWTILDGDVDPVYYGVQVDLVFELPRVHLVVLNVTDGSGNWDNEIFYLRVVDHVPPVADAGPDIEIGQYEEFELNGTRSTDNVGVFNWHWRVEKDGSLQLATVGEIRTVNLFEVGVYQVILTIWDEERNNATDTIVVTVYDTEVPKADAGKDETVLPGETVSLDARSSTDNVAIVSYEWNFAHGGKDVHLIGPTGSYDFTDIGTYTITLTVTDTSGNIGIDTLEVRVLDTVDPLAIVVEVGDIMAGDTVILNGTLSSDNVGIVSYSWTFTYGDEEMNLSGPWVEFTFEEVGEYHINLKVVDAEGNLATDTVKFEVMEPMEQGGDGTPAWSIVVLVLLLLVLISIALMVLRRND